MYIHDRHNHINRHCTRHTTHLQAIVGGDADKGLGGVLIYRGLVDI